MAKGSPCGVAGGMKDEARSVDTWVRMEAVRDAIVRVIAEIGFTKASPTMFGTSRDWFGDRIAFRQRVCPNDAAGPQLKLLVPLKLLANPTRDASQNSEK